MAGLVAVQELTTVHRLQAQELRAKAITVVRDAPIAVPQVAVAVQAVQVVLELELTPLQLVEPQVVACQVPLREPQFSMQQAAQATGIKYQALQAAQAEQQQEQVASQVPVLVAAVAAVDSVLELGKWRAMAAVVQSLSVMQTQCPLMQTTEA